MSLQKCFCSTTKFSKLLCQVYRHKNLRTYTYLAGEKKKISKLSSVLSVNASSSAGLQTDLAAVKGEDKSKEYSSLYHQPIKFEDMSIDKPVPHEDLIAALYKCKTISEQMETLVSILSLHPDDIRNRIRFCKTLELLFKPFFNDFRIQIFGSTVNGFGFKGCDIDLSFETSVAEKDKISYLEPPDVPLVSEIISGKVTPQQISELPRKEQLRFIHNVMLEYYRESEEAPVFINAHVPLVRFHHDKFGLKVDLTFKNRVAFANTKLLYLYDKLDNRVAPLMMTVRYWAKYLEIIGKGLMFNSYTVSLMIVFFLQTRNPPILPSAQSVLSLSDSFEADDMNDKNFLNIIKKIPPTENKQPLDELLEEFIFFYLYFDFTRVICPLTATAVPRKEFFSKSENSQFKMNTFCIQDPTCLPHNVAELVDFKFCKKMSNELLVACNIFLDSDTIKSSSYPWGLISMLETPENYSFRNLITSKVFSFSIPLLTKTIHGNIPDGEQVSASVDTLLQILENSFLFECKLVKATEHLNLLKKQDELVLKHYRECEAIAKSKLELQKIRRRHNKNWIEPVVDTKTETTTNTEPEESMVEQFQKLNAENVLVFCAECKASKNVWQERDLVRLDSGHNVKNILEKEHLISTLAAKENDKREKTKPYLFLCECFVSKDKPENLLLNFRPHEKLYFNPLLGTFLKQYILKIMRNINKGN